MCPIVQNGIKAKHFPLSLSKRTQCLTKTGFCFPQKRVVSWLGISCILVVIRLSVALPAQPLMTLPLCRREISSRSAPADCPWIWGQNMSIATPTKNQSIQGGGMCRHLYSSIRATMRGDDRKISRQTHKDSETVGKQPCLVKRHNRVNSSQELNADAIVDSELPSFFSTIQLWHHLAQLAQLAPLGTTDSLPKSKCIWHWESLRAFMNTFSAKIFKRNKGIDLSIWPKKAGCRSMILWWCKLKVMIWIRHCCWKWAKGSLESFHSSSAFSDFRTLLLFFHTKVCSRVPAVKH